MRSISLVIGGRFRRESQTPLLTLLLLLPVVVVVVVVSLLSCSATPFATYP